MKSNEQWLKLDDVARLEVTSKDVAHPVESALLPGSGSGWRAAQAGPQTVRLVLNPPQNIGRVHLEFQEHELARTQEFSLRWSSDGGLSYREIVRQQYNFSPPHTIEESEDYHVDLGGLTNFELSIVPDISGGPARASLAQLCFALA